jgi:hypothetical protein
MDLYETKSKRSFFSKKSLIIVIVIILVLLAGFAGYKIVKSHKKAAGANQKSNTSQQVSQSIVPSPSQQYHSDNLGLGFNYPNNWVISDVLGSNQLTLTSTVLNLKDSSNQAVQGKVILTILYTSPSSLPAFKSGDATAPLVSQLIHYTNPTSTQKASTYMSYLHYAGSTGSNSSIDGVYITGNLGYQVNQNIHQADVLAVSPIIYYSFVSCSDTSCTSPKPINIPTSLWENKSFSTNLINILESLQIT